jgi:hypothetical protein
VRLQQELKLLHRSRERLFTEAADRALAEISDLQAGGGQHEKRKLGAMSSLSVVIIVMSTS